MHQLGLSQSKCYKIPPTPSRTYPLTSALEDGWEVTFLQLVKGSLWMRPSFLGQGANGKTCVTRTEVPATHFSQRARGWVWVESVSAVTYVVHKRLPASISVSLILRMWKIYSLGLKADTKRQDPLWPHWTWVLRMRLRICLGGNKRISWNSWSVQTESFLCDLGPSSHY